MQLETKVEEMTGKGRGDQGPHPLVRAVLGLLVGVAAGSVVALLLPRDGDGDEPARPGA